MAELEMLAVWWRILSADGKACVKIEAVNFRAYLVNDECPGFWELRCIYREGNPHTSVFLGNS